MMGYGGWMLGGGMMMLFWVGLIVLVAWGVGGLHGGQRSPAPDETPLEILRRRYARGEIGEDEFGRVKRTLTEGSVRQPEGG